MLSSMDSMSKAVHNFLFPPLIKVYHLLIHLPINLRLIYCLYKLLIGLNKIIHLYIYYIFTIGIIVNLIMVSIIYHILFSLPISFTFSCRKLTQAPFLVLLQISIKEVIFNVLLTSKIFFQLFIV